MEQHRMVKGVRGQGTAWEKRPAHPRSSQDLRASPLLTLCAPLPGTAGGSHCLGHTREGPQQRGLGNRVKGVWGIETPRHMDESRG